ncbi:MAG TPA: ATP-binding cassette domain-containing protein [Flavisolibacter sp.]
MVNKKDITATLSILQPHERRSVIVQLFAEAAMILLDLLFLAGFVLLADSILHGNVPGSQLPFTAGPVLILSFLSLFILKSWLGYRVSSFQNRLFYHIGARISKDRMAAYYQSTYHTYVTDHSSAHIYRISQLPVEFCHYVLRGLHAAAVQLLVIVATSAVLFIYRPALFMLVVVVLTPAVVLTARTVRLQLAALKTDTRNASQESLRHLSEGLHAFVEAWVFNKMKFFTRRYGASQQLLNRHLADQQTIHLLPSRFMEVYAVTAFFILAGAAVLFQEVLTTATVAAFLAAAYRIIPAAVKVINGTAQVQAYRFTIVDLAEEQMHTAGESRPAGRLASVEFRDVTFRYNNRPVVSHLDLRVLPGAIVGLTGVSGKGKTTVINLLLGFCQPDEGVILMNGKPCNAEQRRSFFNRISYVKQQPFLMDDSLLSNIVFDDAVPENTLQQLFERTGMQGIINGDATASHKMIREGGRNLSGGQRQRIALARALYKNCDLLILDEPFSELDGMAEAELLRELELLAASGKMILLVSHNDAARSVTHQNICLDQE